MTVVRQDQICKDMWIQMEDTVLKEVGGIRKGRPRGGHKRDSEVTKLDSLSPKSLKKKIDLLKTYRLHMNLRADEYVPR